MRERVHLVKKALAEGRTAWGVCVQMHAPEIVEAVGAAGYDFAFIDAEHSCMYLEGVTTMIRAAEAAGVTPIVRVPNQEPSFIQRVLDAGAMGIIVPHVSNAAQAKAVVAAARYKDQGNGGMRGACPGTRATWHQTTNWNEFVKWSNSNTTIWVNIENAASMQNFDEIAAVPGIDAVMFGPFDFAHETETYRGEPQHPAVASLYKDIMARAKARKVDVVASLFSADPEKMAVEKRQFLEGGSRIVVAGSDRRMVVQALTSRMESLRS